MRGVIILAGGASTRLGRDKALIPLGGKPLITHVLERVSQVVDDIAIVTRHGSREDPYRDLLSPRVLVLRDALKVRSPLVGIVTGLETLRCDYAAILACDTPFASPGVLDRLFEEARGHDAAIPRWPNGMLEPLFSVYRVPAASAQAGVALRLGGRRPRDMIERLGEVAYIPTESLRDLDPELLSFFNINTPSDLEKAERLLTRMRRGQGGVDSRERAGSVSSPS